MIPPNKTLQQISSGYWLARCLHVVAYLGVADAVDDDGTAIDVVAKKVGAHRDALRRVLRALAGREVFELRGTDVVAHTPASRLLRSGQGSLRAMVQMQGTSMAWAAYGELEHAVRTGEPALRKIAPGGFFAYLDEHPDVAGIFDQAMRGKTNAQAAAISAAYDFGAFETITDVGGGRGQFLEAILSAAPRAKGILFDLPRVVEEVKPSERMRAVGGDFFADALPVSDAYVLMQVLHDWSDEEAIRIVRSIRAANPRGRLLVIEAVVPDEPGPSWASLLDVHMLALHTGRERTHGEYEKLLQAAGFRLLRAVATATELSVLEAEATT